MANVFGGHTVANVLVLDWEVSGGVNSWLNVYKDIDYNRGIYRRI